MLRFSCLIIVCLLAVGTNNVKAGEKLLYAIRFESPKRYPDIVSTKIYAVDLKKETHRLIFSDENSNILLLPKRGMPGHPGEVLVSSKHTIFAHAVDKRLDPGRWYSSKASIYELSIDGSREKRKIFDVLGEQSLAEIFVNSSGTKIGYTNYLDQNVFIFIHHARTGKLLHKINMSRVFLDCFVATVGWLPDGNSLFFTLDTGDVHVTSNESYNKRGAYIINEDGTGLIRLPEKLVLFPLEKNLWRATDSPPRFIGGLPDGKYVFRDAWSKKGYSGIETSSFIYKVDPTTWSHMKLHLTLSDGINWFKISHSGRFIAFTEKIYANDGSYEWIEHLWIKNLASGEEGKLFSLDNRPFKGLYLGLVGWIQN